jgi:asparagine N-glycosylation enzyme membrane subunit Stt3
MLSAFARTPAPDLILAAFVLGMAGFVLLAEFWPRRRDPRSDDEEPGPLPA